MPCKNRLVFQLRNSQLMPKHNAAQRHPNWTYGQVNIVFSSSVILFIFYACCRLLQVKTVNIYKENENKKIRF